MDINKLIELNKLDDKEIALRKAIFDYFNKGLSQDECLVFNGHSFEIQKRIIPLFSKIKH